MSLIYIPEEHYVGFQERQDGNEKYLLGFATPNGTDKAFLKRKDTVDNWARQYHYYRIDANKTPNVPSKVMKNELCDGWKISESVRRYGWHSNAVWRVIDPRGFELEISSGNFARVVDCTTIVNGVIQGKCIWGREGAANVLLPENSEPYKAAVSEKEKKTTLKEADVQLGDLVLTRQGEYATYLGRQYACSTSQSSTAGKTEVRLNEVDRKYYYKLDKAPNGFVCTSKFAVTKLIAKTETPLTPQEAAEVLNQSIMENCRLGGWGDTILFFDHESPKNRVVGLVQATKDIMVERNDAYKVYNCYPLLFRKKDGAFLRATSCWSPTVNRGYVTRYVPLEKSRLDLSRITTGIFWFTPPARMLDLRYPPQEQEPSMDLKDINPDDIWMLEIHNKGKSYPIYTQTLY